MNKKKIKAILKKLMICLCFAWLFICTTGNERVLAVTQSEFDAKLNALRGQYPNYSVWNDSFDGGHQCLVLHG